MKHNRYSTAKLWCICTRVWQPPETQRGAAAAEWFHLESSSSAQVGADSYVIDPPFLPAGARDQEEAWAVHEYASFLSSGHVGRGNIGFRDGHVESMKPADASFNNRLWNGFNDARAQSGPA